MDGRHGYLTMSSWGPTIRTHLMRRLILTRSNAAVRSMLAMVASLPASRALAIADCRTIPAVYVYKHQKTLILLFHNIKYVKIRSLDCNIWHFFARFSTVECIPTICSFLLRHHKCSKKKIKLEQCFLFHFFL